MLLFLFWLVFDFEILVMFEALLKKKWKAVNLFYDYHVKKKFLTTQKN